MTRDEIDNFIEETIPGEDVLVADGLESAFLGIECREGTPRAVYSVELAIAALNKQGMTHEEATEYFWFNCAGASVGDQTPVWVNCIEY